MASKLATETETRTLQYPKGLMFPEDFMVFYHFPAFVRKWNELNLTDNDLRALEILLMINPRAGPVMEGTGGLRKCRFSPLGCAKGKSGALRIGYSYCEEQSKIALIVVFAKSGKDNLTKGERNAIKKLLDRAWERL